MDSKTALLRLLDPPLGGDAGADLAAARRSNVVQAVVHVATDCLPPHPHACGEEGQSHSAAAMASPAPAAARPTKVLAARLTRASSHEPSSTRRTVS